MVSPRLLLTNRHVLPDKETAAASMVEFGYEKDERGIAKLQTQVPPQRLCLIFTAACHQEI